ARVEASLQDEDAVGIVGESGLDVTDANAVDEATPTTTGLGQSSQHDGVLGLHLIVAEELPLAHIDPHLAAQIGNSGPLGNLLRVYPAVERVQVHDPVRDADFAAHLGNHNGTHASALLELPSGRDHASMLAKLGRKANLVPSCAPALFPRTQPFDVLRRPV